MLTIFMVIGFITQWVWYPFQLFADADIRYQFMTNLLFTHQNFLMRYSSVAPLFSTPLYYLDLLVKSPYFVLRFNLIIFFAALLIWYNLLKPHLSKHITLVFLALLLFASMFPGHLIHYYGDVFSALTIGLGILLLEKRKFFWGILLSALSVANAPATMPAIILYVIWKSMKERNIRYVLIPMLATVFVLLDYKLRYPRILAGFTTYLDDRGFPTILPYAGLPGFSYPLVFGLLGELFSFGKGLLFFAPGLLLLPITIKTIKDKVLQQTVIGWTIYIIGLCLAYGRWWGWYGGWFWGPRYLLFASIPATFALAYTLVEKKLPKWITVTGIFLTLFSFWVGINGVVFQQKGMDICTKDNFVLEHLCWYTPEYSALFHPFVLMPKVDPVGWFTIIYTSIVGLWIVVPIVRRILTK